jgi:hypothetical protein
MYVMKNEDALAIQSLQEKTLRLFSVHFIWITDPGTLCHPDRDLRPWELLAGNGLDGDNARGVRFPEQGG